MPRPGRRSAGPAFIASGDATEVFEVAKETFDEVTVLVLILIKVPHFAVISRGGITARRDEVDQCRGIEGLFDVMDQRVLKL